MNTHNDGGPAFPRAGFLSEMEGNTALPYDNYPEKGMTLRDWFAGQSLGNSYMGDYSPLEQGRVAYEIADSMLAAREKGGAK